VRTREFGRTGRRISEVGFGAWAIGGNAYGNSYGPTDDALSLAAVRRALDLGCTFFDTADVYGWGHSERLLGEALEGRRDEVFLATKVGGDFYHGGVQLNFDPEYIRFALDRSLERLRTDHVDLYQLHNPPAEVFGDPATDEVLDALQGEDRIRHYGVSVHEPGEALAAIRTGKPAAIQVPFSLLRQEWIDEVLPAAERAGVAVIAREPLANGFLTGKFTGAEAFPPGDIRSRWPRGALRGRAQAAGQFAFLRQGDRRTLAQGALAFVLAFPAVATTIPGMKSPAHAEENLAASGTALAPEEIARCRETYAKVTG
jgi:aryl-alcohol dehydrogenase-like predicted oxidoreductase